MGWRFRHSFKIIPGVRLNLSKTGLSASIGGAPFTLNVSPRGVMGTASIPGTGISYREHFGSGNPSGESFLPPAAPSPALPSPAVWDAVPFTGAVPSGAPVQEIHSASTELMTSESLQELKRLLQTTFEEREDIANQLKEAQSLRRTALQRFESWNEGWLFKRIFKKAFAKRKDIAETETAKVNELEEQLRLTTVAAQIDISREQAEPYFKMRDAFAGLCECAAIWDIKTRQVTDRFHERTTATERIGRERVAFSVDSCELIQWEQKVPHLRNAKGGDLFLYPGFILYRAAHTAFSVIDYHDLNGGLKAVRFEEEEGVPKDSKVVGQTWAKANKDGSRDKRFADNHQIPVVVYAHLTLRSSTGLWEEFHFSDVDKSAAFVAAVGMFEKSFAPQQSSQQAGKPN